MKQNIQSLPLVQTARLVLLVVLHFTLAWAIISLNMPQIITGTCVNALLISSLLSSGLQAAVLLGLTTPMMAAFSGVLPCPVQVMIPFIALGNTLYIFLFARLQKYPVAWAVVAAATVKFLWLFGSAYWLAVRPMHLMIGQTVQTVSMPDQVMAMMSWPQLLTALLGGSLAAIGYRRFQPRLRPPAR